MSNSLTVSDYRKMHVKRQVNDKINDLNSKKFPFQNVNNVDSALDDNRLKIIDGTKVNILYF